MNAPGARPALPSAANGWAVARVDQLLDSHRRLTGRALYDGPETGAARARAVFEADFVLLAHGVEEDPLFDYANRTALALFEMDWTTLVCTPSRQSAEAAEQATRERFMRTVREHGYTDDYSGVRVSAAGRRFRIDGATVWNVIDAGGAYLGQAASFSRWTYL